MTAAYREIAAAALPAPFRPLVECAWQAATPPGGHRQRVLPDGCMDLIMIGGRLVVAGPDTAAHVADQEPGSALTGLRFRPGALPRLLGVPADALRDQRTDLPDLLGPTGSRTAPRHHRADLPDLPGPTGSRTAPHHHRSDLPDVSGLAGPATALRRDRNDLSEFPGGADMHVSAVPGSRTYRGVHLGADVRALLDVASRLAARDDRSPLPAPVPAWALGALVHGASTADVADRLGVTTRTLHRTCTATLGYGPSVARRVLRFRAAAALLFDGVAPATVAARTGYADQPHLSREVRALSGVSPTALAAG